MSDSDLSLTAGIADGDTPSSKLDDLALVSRARAFVKRAGDLSSRWRADAREAYDLEAGHHWSDEDRALLDEQARVAVTFNRIQPVIEAVCGSQVNNRQDIRFLPRGLEPEAEAKAAAASDLCDWARDQCDAEDEESDAFKDAVVCGMGWTEVRLDTTEIPEGRIVIERVDPLEMYWDGAARKKNLTDAKELARVRLWRLDDVQAEWPDKAEDVAAGFSGTDDPDRELYAEWRDPLDAYGGSGSPGAAAGHLGSRMVKVIHYAWAEHRPVWVILNPITGQREELDSQDKVRAVEERLAALWRRAPAEVKARIGKAPPPLRAVKQSRLRWQEALICGMTVLSRGPAPDPSLPRFQAITGKRDRNRACWRGLVWGMRDPQKWANKWLSQSMRIIDTQAKGGVMVETDAVSDPIEFEQSYATTGSVTWMRPGGIAKLRDKPSTTFPAGFQALLQFAVSSIPDVSGINKELMGLTDRDQPGILEAHRKQAAQSILSPLFDSLRHYHKRQGRLLHAFLRQYMPQDMQVRVQGEDGDPRLVSAAMMDDSLRFDVVVDEAPTSPNTKTETWLALQPVLPLMAKQGLPLDVWLEILRFSPIPEAAQSRIVKALRTDQQQKAQAPPPPDPRMEKVKADAQADQAKLQGEQQLDQQRLQSEREMAVAELQLRREVLMLEMQMKREDMEMRRQDQQQMAAMRLLAQPAPAPNTDPRNA